MCVVVPPDETWRCTLHLATTRAAAVFAFTPTTLFYIVVIVNFFIVMSTAPHSNHERCVNVHRFYI